ncbi:MAG: nucleotidyltransferase domain-containing protein [Saprospiraceae bacterium]|nr:nucleotidyltransferase domain-containing protein [Saprospiraceae bacterium]
MLLREKDKVTLHKIFDTCDYSIEVLAFGSRVNGDAHEGSDLDLVIKCRERNGIPVDVFNDLSDLIRDSLIPILVDFRDWDSLPQTCHTNIMAKYEVFYSNL